MPVFYTKPVLRDLSQGARIAYVRQFRHMTQEELGEKIEMSPGRRRNRICSMREVQEIQRMTELRRLLRFWK